MMEKRKKLIIGSVAVVLVIILISVAAILVRNYLHLREIVQITNYTKGLPSAPRENLEIQLRRLLENHFEVPEDAQIFGTIREETIKVTTDNGEEDAEFILDIDAYQQTYQVVLSLEGEELVPDGILIKCPATALMKYPETECFGMYNNSDEVKAIEKNPLYNELPIVVDEFDFAARMSIHYEIRGYFNDSYNLVIVITDESGGNYEAVLRKIRELGYEPGDYIIQYIDNSGDF